MTNIDKKIRLILRLNSSLKRLEKYIFNNVNAPIFMQKDINKAIQEKEIIKNVLINLNYLNY